MKPTPPSAPVITPRDSLEELLLKDPALLSPEDIDQLRLEMLRRLTAPLPVATPTGQPVAAPRPTLSAYQNEEVSFDMPLGACGHVFMVGDLYFYGPVTAPRHIYIDLMRRLQMNATIEAERLVNRGVVGKTEREKDYSRGHMIPDAHVVPS